MSDHNFKKLSMQRWLVATLELDRESAREALGKPDLIETDRFAGRRGLEDHWFFLDDAEQKLQLVYSDRQGHVLVFADPPDLSWVTFKLSSLIDGCEPREVKPPIQYPSE